MTWLTELPAGDTDWERLRALFPSSIDAFDDIQRAAWTLFDPVVLELCRLRMATLLRFDGGLALRSEQARAAGLDEEKIAALASWPTSPLFSAAERACLALAEQFLMDANGVTDELVGDVLKHYSGEECYRLVTALSAFERLQRGCLTLGLDTSPESAWLTES
jgi:alkylhydroperoxidase family enzyme